MLLDLRDYRCPRLQYPEIPELEDIVVSSSPGGFSIDTSRHGYTYFHAPNSSAVTEMRQGLLDPQRVVVWTLHARMTWLPVGWRSGGAQFVETPEGAWVECLEVLPLTDSGMSQIYTSTTHNGNIRLALESTRLLLSYNLTWTGSWTGVLEVRWPKGLQLVRPTSTPTSAPAITSVHEVETIWDRLKCPED